MAISRSHDSGFYELVHQLLGDVSAEKAEERRRDPRHPYRCFQWIAPCPHNRIPPKWLFRQVECVDLSHNGLAYYTPERPEYKTVAVGLNRGHSTLYLAAAIVRCLDVEHDDGPMYLVGCRFIGRIE